jgi:hypothetical protein
MKTKKKTVILVGFILGAVLFTTTALADIVTKSGYDQLKDALKLTAENCSDKFDSFTWELSYAIQDNGKILASENSTEKYDRKKSATESISHSERVNGQKYNSNSFRDRTSIITYSASDQTCYVTEFTQERKPQEVFFTNPFKENRAEDIEKIADALVGSLKDYVVVTENPDGGKLLSGSLTEVQIPPLVNAVASFYSKQEFTGYGDSNDRRPYITRDIFVKEIKGTASLNKDGILESILGTVVLSGKDEQGEVHSISIEVLGKLTDINATTVSKPDLTGKNIIKNTVKEEKFGPEISNPQKFIGKFKNDILIEKDGKFVKLGERFIEITQMDNQTVAGRYYEEYKQGFEEYAGNKLEFNFDARFDDNNPQQVKFDYTDESGTKKQGNIYFDIYSGKLNLGFESQKMGRTMFDSTFSLVIE